MGAAQLRCCSVQSTLKYTESERKGCGGFSLGLGASTGQDRSAQRVAQSSPTPTVYGSRGCAQKMDWDDTIEKSIKCRKKGCDTNGAMMAVERQDREEPIAALATPWSRSALAVIRVSGDGAIEQFGRLFSAGERLLQATGHTLHYGYVMEPSGERLDSALVALFRAPRSYTGQDALEIGCHGSPAGIERILGLLYRHGFRQAEPGEFTLRAFLAGKLDLTQAEAIQEIVSARTARAHAVALERLAGSVQREIDDAKGDLVRVLAAVSVQLDYPEEETGAVAFPHALVESVIERLKRLLATYRLGRIVQDGIAIAIAGGTNAGKSSLFNLLVRQERAIVSDLHGTTRDYIEAQLVLDGVPVRLYDTAGLRVAEGVIENEGIRRSRELIAAADIVIYVIDASVGERSADAESIATLAGRASVVVWNKIDLLSGVADAAVPAGRIGMSMLHGEGQAELLERLGQLALPQEIAVPSSDPIIDSERQRDLIERCLQALRQCLQSVEQRMPADMVALDLQEAIQALGEITGAVTSADVLETMFAGFCVGK